MNASVRPFAFRSCPFCGSDKALRFWTTADLHEGCDFDDGGEAYHAVVCSAEKPHGLGGCGASGGFQPTRELAALAISSKTNRGLKMQAPRTGIEAFCGRADSEDRLWMHKPWIENGNVYATNGHIIIEVPMILDALLGAVEKYPRSPNNIAKMFDDAFAAPVWRKLPKLPAFDPCPSFELRGRKRPWIKHE